MNSYPTKSTMKINGLFATKNARNAAMAAVLLSAFSSSAFANRPAMEESGPAVTATETSTQIEPAPVQTHPRPQTPSAVEMMMQNQKTQQTGDVVQIPAKEMQPGETLRIKLLDFPRRGMSMEKVQREFGQPIATSASVGKPPITSWTYNDRVVYFEYSTVLHVVAR